MSRKNKIIKIAVGLCCCLLLFCGTAYFYFAAANHAALSTEQSADSVPYAAPESHSVSVTANGHTFLFVPDFSAQKVSVYCAELPADYTLTADRQACADIIDRFGGLTLTVNGAAARCTGVQVTDLADTAADPEGFFTDCLRAFAAAVAEHGISQADFAWLFSVCETDLNLPICFSWPNVLPQALKNIEIHDS